MTHILSMTKRFVLASLVCLAPNMVAAGTLNCGLTKTDQTGGWIPTQSQIKYDLTNGTATAAYTYRDQPVELEGTVDDSDAGRFTFRFISRGVTNSDRQYTAQFVYTVIYIKKNGRLSVHAKPMGYANHFRGSGRCKPA